jgi:hypothetical protein
MNLAPSFHTKSAENKSVGSSVEDVEDIWTNLYCREEYTSTPSVKRLLFASEHRIPSREFDGFLL